MNIFTNLSFVIIGFGACLVSLSFWELNSDSWSFLGIFTLFVFLFVFGYLIFVEYKRKKELGLANRRCVSMNSIRGERINKKWDDKLWFLKHREFITSLFLVLLTVNSLEIAKNALEQTNIKDRPKVVFMNPQFESKEDGAGRLSYVLENTGEIEAKNVKIKFSVCTLHKCSTDLFDDGLINTLYPGIPHKFGYSDFTADAVKSMKEMGDVLFVINVNYDNPLKPKTFKEDFYYGWDIESGFTSVLEKDLCIEKFGKLKEGELKDFLTDLDICKLVREKAGKTD